MTPSIHNNAIYRYAFYAMLSVPCGRAPKRLQVVQVLAYVDNKLVVDSFDKGRSRNDRINRLLQGLFSLQVNQYVLLRMQLAPSEINHEIYTLTRPARCPLSVFRHTCLRA